MFQQYCRSDGSYILKVIINELVPYGLYKDCDSDPIRSILCWFGYVVGTTIDLLLRFQSMFRTK